MALPLVLALAGCGAPSPPQSAGEGAGSERALPWSTGKIDGFHIVDCQFPGRMMRLPGGTPIPVAGRISRTTADECADSLGQYILYDRANFGALRRLWLPKARNGDAEAQVHVGDLYLKGIDGDPDYDEARAWYQRAAQQDFSPASMRLSYLYEKGLGVPRDRDRAEGLAEQATGLKMIPAAEPDDVAEAGAEGDTEQPSAFASEDRLDDEYRRRLAEIDAKEQELARRDAELGQRRAELKRQEDEAAAAETVAASDSAQIADLKRQVAELQSDLGQVRDELTESHKRLSEVQRQRIEAASAGEPILARMGGFDFGTYRALVIGNGSYPDFAGGELFSAVEDAKAVAALLADRYGYEVLPLYNATRSQILNALRVLKQELRQNDNLLVYYAGHGEFENDQGYWLANDFGEDPNAAIPTSEISGILRSMDAKHVLVIADSCYARALIDGAVELSYGGAGQPDVAWIKLAASRIVRLALTSGGLNPVLDSVGGRHSIFAAALLEQLGTNDDVMEAARLFRFVAADVQEAAKSLELEQIPTYSSIKGPGDSGGDYFFVPQES